MNIASNILKLLSENKEEGLAIKINAVGQVAEIEINRPFKRSSPFRNFGEAIEALKKGLKVARKGWNGKGIFIELQVPDENSKMSSPYIYIDTTGLQTDNSDAPKSLVPWLASQTDMLADDWVIIE